MLDAKVIFTSDTLDDVNLIIECSNEDKMKDICQKYATKIKRNIDSLIFLYKGSQINFELTFSNQADSIDRNNGKMKILVNKKKNSQFNSPKNKDSSKDYNNTSKNNIEVLKKVKSKYIVDIFFSYIDEKIKLKIVKYNKHLQNIINIKLINYKFFSRRYIIYNKNGIAREYSGYNDELIFELDGNNLIIQCSSQDKMKDICQKYATKINKNIDSLLFIYEGNKINFVIQ